MDLFEYILILTSVIFALAVAEILDGVSRLAQLPHPVRTFLPHTIWVLNLFIFVFLIWWASWEFRYVDWSFPFYAYMLIAPTLLFLACSLLIPQQLREGGVDLEDHFFRVRRLFFAAFFFGALAVMIDGNVLGNEGFWHTGRVGHGVILSAAATGYFSENRRLHLILAVATLLAFAGLSITRFLFPR